LKLGTILTIILVILAVISVSVVVLGQYQQSREEYRSIAYTYSRITLRYDYSCDENVYGLSIALTNYGEKMVQNFEVSVTNELCVGSIPPLPSMLNSGQSIQFYVYSTEQNGTVSILGNNTDIVIQF
jgi:hypothetical protein